MFTGEWEWGLTLQVHKCDEEAGPSSSAGPSSAESPDSPYRKYKSTIYFNQRKNIPLNPNSVEEAESYFESEFIKGLLSKSVEGNKIYHIVSSNQQSLIVLFASEEILNNLPDTRYFNITTTMRVVPSLGIFTVLLTVSVIKDYDVNAFEKFVLLGSTILF